MSDECKHDNFVVKGNNMVGWGTCTDCGKVVQLNVLFNRLRDRMLAVMDDWNRRNDDQTKKI